MEWNMDHGTDGLFLAAAAHSGYTGLCKVNETLVFTLIDSSCLVLNRGV